MHVSSTEPTVFYPLGDVSTLPEKYGVDFLWHERGWCGVQRKEVKDFLASLRDGRLAREVAQMRALRVKLLVLEGQYLHVGDRVTTPDHRADIPLLQWQSALWVLQSEGVWYTHTGNPRATYRAVEMLEAWTAKTTHTALGGTRDAVPRTNWGRHDDRLSAVHLLTGIAGVGEELAGRIVDHFGKVPWRWECTEEELCQVDGIGKVRAARMMKALGAFETTRAGGPR